MSLNTSDMRDVNDDCHSLPVIYSLFWLSDCCFAGGKIAGSLCSVSGVLLITPFLPIIFDKFNRFQLQEETSPTAKGQDTRDQQRPRAYSTPYEINESLVKKKTRRYTIG